jgi:TetR/AcrR family transcriptional regulator
VEAAGVTKPTLYHYFGSKRGLLEAILSREANGLYSKIKIAAEYHGDLVLTLENIAKTFFKAAREDGAYYRMQTVMFISPPESEANQAIQPYMQAQAALLEEAFIRAAEDHGNLRGRHQRYAAGFLGEINALIGLYLNNRLELTGDTVYRLVHQFMHGIFS